MIIKIQLFGGRGAFSGGTYIYRNKNLPVVGPPNSKLVQYKNGKKYRERIIGNDGKAKTDTDWSNHGNAKRHPKVPHSHDWDWTNKEKPRGDWY